MSLTEKSLDDIVRPEMREEYERVGKTQYLATDKFTGKTPGLFKLECSGDAFIGLASKVYCVRIPKGKGKAKHKGLSRRLNNMNFETYKSTLFGDKPVGGINRGFMVRNGVLYQYEQSRDALSAFYYKRKVLDDKVTTRALQI
jgi:hypothetical protein